MTVIYPENPEPGGRRIKFTLAEFLLERIAEDEAVARSAYRPGGAPVYAEKGETGTAALLHITRHDPARVLAECEAKRQIVEWCGSPFAEPIEVRRVLELLALPYADHADYDEGWKP